MCSRRPSHPPPPVLGAATLAAGLLFAAACGEAPPDGPPAPLTVDATAAAGLDFVHQNGMTGELYFCEMMGAGGALFDADNDGDLDLYLVQAGPLDAGGGPAVGDRLWRNDLAPGSGGAPALSFTDVTDGSGLAAFGYGMGVAAGDVDNDGWTDLYVTNLGPDQLWRNQGAGGDGRVTFRDATAEAGLGDERWSTSASFFDYDGDGWLDLYVVSYVDFRLAANKPCRSATGRRDYCGPQSYRGETDRLYRNLGASGGAVAFEDVSGAAGILAEAGAGMGVVASDFDGDGRVDLYVANDQTRNLLWINRGDGTFADRALIAGCAANAEGRAEASMGVAAGDVDNDGDDDLFMTHLRYETNTLYRNDGRGVFEDATLGTRVGAPSLGATGFGAALFDLDNDGWLDLAAVNGAVIQIEELAAAGDPFPLHQPNQLLRHLGPAAAGGVRFAAAGPEAGGAFTVSEVSRGLAAGDVDNDGDTDLVIFNNHGPARLALNAVGQDRPWLGLRLVGGEGREAGPRRDMLGARVTLRRRGAPDLLRRVHADGSYCSAGDPRVLFGLGAGSDLEAVRVRWPDGTVEEWPPPAVGRYTTLTQGGGRPMGEG